MAPVTRNVRDLPTEERRVFEAVLGERLHEDQQVMLQVITPGSAIAAEPDASSLGALPEWCNVYEGLTDAEIAEIESVILDRSHWNRQSP